MNLRRNLVFRKIMDRLAEKFLLLIEREVQDHSTPGVKQYECIRALLP
jgi:hypothetical protein